MIISSDRLVILGLALLGLLSMTADAAKERPLVIVALGDSTTAGTPYCLSPLESPPDGQGDPEGQYTYWMMKRRPQWKVINSGINGQRSDEIRARFDDSLKFGPRYLIILAGVNDIVQGTPLAETCKNLLWMFKQAKLRSIIPIVSTVLPFDRATPEQSKQIDALNEWIQKAADHERIPVADLHSAVADPTNPARLNGSPDGLHPDVGGYRKMGIVLMRIIDGMEASLK